MDPEITQRLDALQAKVDAMYTSVERLRQYFLWTGIITVALIVIPMIGLVFVIPTFLNSYANLDTIDSGSSNSTSDLLQLLTQ